MIAGASNVKPRKSAVMPPMTIWPSAPMLNSPAWKPTATASPARISGVAAKSVSEIALTRAERTDEQRLVRATDGLERLLERLAGVVTPQSQDVDVGDGDDERHRSGAR